MAKKFYAQKDALGFPIPGTMMSASEVPGASNIIEISTQSGVTVFKGSHPEGLRYYVRVDNSGMIIPNSLLSGTVVPQGAVELGSGNKCVTLTVQAYNDNDLFDFGLETYELDEDNYVKGTINWGDGSAETEINILDDGNTDWFNHTYATAGVYTVTVCIDRPDMIQDAEFGFDEGNVRVTNVQNFNNWNGVDELDLTGSRLTSYTLSGNQLLDEFFIDESTLLTSVSVTNCPNLTSIDLSDCPLLTTIDFSGCPLLDYIELDNSAITSQSLQTFLAQVASGTVTEGTLFINGEDMPVPNTASLSHIDTLIQRGWEISYNHPPVGMTYSNFPSEVYVGSYFGAAAPTLTRGLQPLTFTVSPALPDGIQIDPGTGSISGTPSTVTSSATYTVTATNEYGSTTTTVTFSIAS